MRHNGHLSELGKGIIKTLIYHDIFRYPLTPDEIKRLCQSSAPHQKFEAELKKLEAGRKIFRNRHFFSVKRKPEKQVIRRLDGNRRAEKKMRLAFRMSRIIASFPFVRAVMLSGSISIGFMEDDSDIDFFVITAPKKVWTAKALLLLFKRLFLFNSYRYFCINYLLGQEKLEIEEKNIFTATELVTLIPTYGVEYYNQFLHANRWTHRYYPNFKRNHLDVPLHRLSLIKRTIERVFNNRLGDKFDTLFMKIFYKRAKKRYGVIVGKEDFNIAFKTNKNVSKAHLNNYQRKITEAFNLKIREFEDQHNISLQ